MRKPIAWGGRGSGVEVRDAARKAARRAGLTLGEWLAEAVGQYAAQIGTDPIDLDEEERAEAVAIRLQRLGIRGDDRRSAQAKQVASRNPEDALLERAVARLEDDGSSQHIDDRRRSHVAQIEELEARSARLYAAAAQASAAPCPQAQSRPRAAAKRHPSLAAAIAEISRHQTALEETDGTGNDGAERFRTRYNRYTGLGNAPEPSHTGYGATLETVQNEIAALARQIESLRHDQIEHSVPPPACDLDKLRTEIATMSDALRGLTVRNSTAPLETAIHNLTHQIETSRGDGIRETLLQPLERMAGELRLALAELDPRTTIRGLEGEIQKLGDKLDDLGRHGYERAALGVIDSRTREIHELLASGANQLAPVEKITQSIDALSARLDRMRELNDRHAARHDDADFQAIADEMRLLTGDAGRAAFAKIEDQLDAINAKVDEALAEARDESHYTALANRINDIHRELAERMSQGTQIDVRALEELVRQLADKIGEANGPLADSRAIEALQRQVGEFAAQLDRANSGFPSLASLEQSIGDLFAELERTRDVTYTTAENAARSALEQTLAKVNAVAGQSDVAHDLVELRNMQDEAGRRTFATLNAVHETLERVVDRLATVENEIADVRRQHPAELLASGPPPNFIPSPVIPPAAVLRGGTERHTSGEQQALETGRLGPHPEIHDDFLIEPGRGFPRRGAGDNNRDIRPTRRPNEDLEQPEPLTGRQAFIAAARRAAREAQLDATASANKRTVSHGGQLSEGSDSLVGQARSFVANHKRPVMLSLAALVLAFGAYAVVRTVGHAPLIDIPIGHSRGVPAGRRAPATVPGTRLPKPAAVNEHAPKQDKDPSAALTGADPIVTGTIGPMPQNPYTGMDSPVTPAPTPPAEAEATAAVVLQNLAQAGNAKAQYQLADDYTLGRGVSRDFGQAAHWYEKAAAQGLAPAEYRLGSLYEKGLGVKRDIGHAMALYRKAAEHGNVRAMHNLGVLAAEGGDTGKPDYATAAHWFRIAAEYGVHDSQYNLAILLARGLGVEQNFSLSYAWFAVAAAQGDEDAGKKRDDVAARLSADELVAAKATAAAFHPKTPDPAANEVNPPQGGWRLPPTNAARSRPKISQL